MTNRWLLATLGLLGMLAWPVQAAKDPFAELQKEATAYSAALAKQRGPALSPQDQATLAGAARLLTDRKFCGQAVDLRRLALAGPNQVGTADWSGLAADALCAKRWDDALYGAWMALGKADPKHKRPAWLLLGKAMEAHPRHGAASALVAYRQALALGEDAKLRELVGRLEQDALEASALRVDRHFIQAGKGLPSICLTFNRAIPDPGQQRYGDYVRFEPPFPAEFRKESPNELCADGAEFATQYRVRVLKGLAGDEGLQLLETFDQPIDTGDRPPSLRFENNYYVLPAGSDGVPIHALNVPKARLTLFRIGDRNLVHEFVLGNFRTDLSKWSLQRIRDHLGEWVWSGEVDLPARPNETTLANLPVAALAKPAPGVYILNADALGTATPGEAAQEDQEGDDPEKLPPASQWFLVSDLGISSYRGADGLSVVTRSLADATALPGVRLALYGRNNLVLGEQVSDAKGQAHFPAGILGGKGGREPVLLLASGPQGDFNFFDISGAPFDLSDRGVGGRAAPGPLDAFLFTERGVYRPGEPVHLSLLLRNELGVAVEGLPLTLRLLRPDEQLAVERVIQPQGAGGYSELLELSASARTGHWKVQAFADPKGAPVGEVRFLVDSIVPPRIEVELQGPATAYLLPGTSGRFGALARYLFGAPAADLGANGELLVARDPDPFPGFPGFRYGPLDEPDDTLLTPLTPVKTDAQGQAQFDFQLERLPKLRQPLRARLRAEVTDVDGRPVGAEQWTPVRQDALYLGVKAPDGPLPAGAEAQFEVVALDRDAQPQTRQLGYRLLEEQVHYQWYQNGGRWLFKRQIRDRLLQEGSLDVTEAGPARLALHLAAGRYRLDVRAPDTDVLTSARVQAGWEGDLADLETPDQLSLNPDQPSYRPGELAKLRLQAPFAGRADLVIATDRVLEIREIQVSGQEQVVDVAVPDNWGAGAYALVTAFRPDGAQAGHGPRRAVGVAWLGIAKEGHALRVTLDPPALARPRGQLNIGVQVTDTAPGTPLFISLAAVDEGVLQLTDYRTPDPLGYFFGQRSLAVGLRDLYGRLLDGRKGQPAQLRSGAGLAGRQGMPESHVRILSLFSGIKTLDADGRVQIPLDLPDFNGRVRLMAVAWSPARVGSGEGAVTVRDPVVVMPALPRFLAAGDTSLATLLIQNLDGPASEYRLTLEASGALEWTEPQPPRAISLAPGQRQVLKLPVRAKELGNGQISVTLDGPPGTGLTKTAEVGIRAPFLPETRRRFAQIGGQSKTLLGPDLTQGLRPETLGAQVTLSGQPDLDVLGLLKQLDLYPYGCLEQVVSRAFPLLQFEKLAARWEYQGKVPARQRLSQAVALIQERQLENGAFTLWDPDGGEHAWLTVHALDFLQRAKEAGLPVADFRWRRGLEWLRREIQNPNLEEVDDLAVQAYALYVLSRAGESHAETARYLLDEAGDSLPPLAAAHLGAALANLGDRERAGKAFALAAKQSREPGARDFGSPLRDLAARVLLLAEAPAGSADPAASLRELVDQMRKHPWLSTQEQAWLVRAAAATSGDGEPLRLRVHGEPVPERTKPLILNPGLEQFKPGLELVNEGKSPVWLSAAVNGSPLEAPPPLNAGFRIQRRFLNLQGKPVNLQQVPQGEVLVVLLEGKADSKDLDHQALIVDPLAAGLEIESPQLAKSRSISDLGWLGDLSTALYMDGLDDRFVAALDLLGEEREFRLAYLVRAVTPGTYRLPPTEVEDMYSPRYRARGDSGTLVVVPAR